MIDMESRTACFTGHRELPTDNLPEISKHLKDTLVTLIEQGYRYFGAGGALGFDTLATQVVLRLRERYPQIRLILVLPCFNQIRRWQQADVDIYEELKRRKVIFGAVCKNAIGILWITAASAFAI